jgi:hypothetical protein
MFLEHFISSTSNKADIQSALSILFRINFFSVMYELAFAHAGGVPVEGNIAEKAAIRRGITLGYHYAIQDLLNADKLFGEGKVTKIPDYGAGRKLKEYGLTEEEIQNAREQLRADSSGSK